MMLVTDQESRSMMLTLVKAVFFQMEFGIRAGLERRSWRPTQKMNVGARARDMARSAMLIASWRFEALAVMVLYRRGESVLMDEDGRTRGLTQEHKTAFRDKHWPVLPLPSQSRFPNVAMRVMAFSYLAVNSIY